MSTVTTTSTYTVSWRGPGLRPGEQGFLFVVRNRRGTTHGAEAEAKVATEGEAQVKGKVLAPLLGAILVLAARVQAGIYWSNLVGYTVLTTAFPATPPYGGRTTGLFSPTTGWPSASAGFPPLYSAFPAQIRRPFWDGRSSGGSFRSTKTTVLKSPWSHTNWRRSSMSTTCSDIGDEAVSGFEFDLVLAEFVAITPTSRGVEGGP